MSDHNFQVRRLAKGVREVLESKELVDLAPFFREFPTQCCEAASQFLAALTAECGMNGGEIVLANRRAPYDSHAWFEVKGFVVDVTADQFPEGQGPVIVTRTSPWHGTWTVRKRYSFDASGLQRGALIGFPAAYELIKRRVLKDA